jgi:hypothetical protein
MEGYGMKTKKASLLRGLLILLLPLFVLGGCGSTGGMDRDGDGGDDGDGDAPVAETVGSISLSASRASILADGQSTTLITAQVQNQNGLLISRSVTVNFSTSQGTLAQTSATTENGSASVTLISSTQESDNVSVSASAEGVTPETPLTISFLPVPAQFSISASQTTVPSDNSDRAAITVTVLDSSRVPIGGFPVAFQTTGGQISSSSVLTDPELDEEGNRLETFGQARIFFRAGEVEPANQTVTVSAEVSGLGTKSIPIQIVGTEITLTTDQSNLDVEKEDVAELTIQVQDSGDGPVFDAEVTATVVPGSPGDPNVPKGDVQLRLASTPDVVDENGVLTGRTNASGELKLQVIGTAVGQATVEVSALGDRKTQTYSVSSTANTFAIVSPESDPVGLLIGEGLNVRVRNPSGAPVRFSTTFGSWNNGGQVVDVPLAADGTAAATLSGGQAGLANVQVFDLGDAANNTSDSLEVAIAAPSSSATQVSLQANPSVVAPSTGEITNTSSLTATVRNVNDQVVGNAPVAFSIEQTTGGGERISPVIAYTNSFGVATTTFFSGSLSSGGEGVRVRAVVLSASDLVQDAVDIVIGGTAGSVLIGRGTGIRSSEDETNYILPMSVLVTDSNGNPVPGAKVTLGSWPTRYRRGFWTDEPCDPVVTGVFLNEDQNRNLTLDPGEDQNGDGQITPPSSAAGAVGPPTDDGETGGSTFIVETGQDGVAAFQLTYIKTSAVWVETEISASTTVFGSETRSTYTDWLPIQDGDECNLPNSPYNLATLEGNVELFPKNLQMLPDGAEQAEITAFVQDAGGNPAADDTVVSFQLSGDGQLSSPTASTSDGAASVTYTSGTQAGTVTITASVEDASPDSITVELARGELELTPDRLSLISNGAEEVALNAQVFDLDGNLLDGATQVLFRVEQGPPGLSPDSGLPGSSGKTEARVVTASGLATAYYKPEQGVSGSVTISARADGVGALPDQATISLNPAPIGDVDLDPAPASIAVGPESFSTITATVEVADGDPAPPGTAVVFETTKGTFDGGGATLSTEVQNNDGEAFARLLRGAEEGGIATVSATAGGVTRKVNIEFVAEDPEPLIQGIDASVSRDTIDGNGRGTAVVTANITPIDGQDADGVRVTFRVDSPDSGGRLDGGATTVEKTTTSGLATAVLTSGNPGASDAITVSAQGFSDQVEVSYSAGNLGLSALSIGGTGGEVSAVSAGDTVTLRATLTGSNVAGQTVDFSVDDSSLGIVSPASVVTNASGVAETTFSSANKSGEVTITARADFFSEESITIAIQSPPAFIELSETSPNPALIGVRGTQGPSASIITFDVKDATGEPASDGFRFDFEIASGPNGGEELLIPFAATSGGQVSTTLRTGTKPGSVLVRATYHEDANVNTTSTQIGIESGLPVGEEFGLRENGSGEGGDFDIGRIMCVSVADVYGNSAPENTIVNLKTYNTGGLVDDPTILTSNGSGCTTLFYDRVGNTQPFNGVISVTAETTGAITTRVNGFAIHPESPFNAIVYAATNGGGVYKSTDSGTTWRNVSRSTDQVGQNWIDPYVNDIVVDPENPNILYAATGYGERGNIFQSLDGGVTWDSNNDFFYDGILAPKTVPILSLVVDYDDDEASDLADDLRPVIWAGTDGDGILKLQDTNGLPNGQLEVTFVGPNAFEQVNDLVKVKDASILYAATATGAYKKEAGVDAWAPKNDPPFTGYFINTLEIHPSSTGGGNDVVYAGTRDNGVWISTDSGNNWTQVPGLGKAIRVTAPKPDRDNVGTGTVTDLALMDEALSENWTIEFTGATSFEVTGSVSGLVDDSGTVGAAYVLPGVLEFTVEEGGIPFEAEDRFTFTTIRDDGKHIKDLLVDSRNDVLYALTYFDGALEPHATSNLFAHELESNGAIGPGGWQDAGEGLPQFAPPTDTSLLAHWALGGIPPSEQSPTEIQAILIGGEDVSVSKASSGLETGAPDWLNSDNGMNRQIMARVPVLIELPETAEDRALVLPVGTFNGTSFFNFELTLDGLVEFEFTYIGEGALAATVSGNSLEEDIDLGAIDLGGSRTVRRDLPAGTYSFQGTETRQTDDPAGDWGVIIRAVSPVFLVE